MAAFTPGPWQWEFGEDDVLMGANNEDVLWGVWHNDNTAGLGIDEADAHLIAAAPDLYEACKLTQEWGAKPPRAIKASDVYELLQKVQSAVAKAEGK